MSKLPPLPAGFEEVPEDAPVAAQTSSTALPPVPAGFEEISEEAPKPTPVDDNTYDTEVRKIIDRGGSVDEVKAYDAKVGRSSPDNYKAVESVINSGARNYRIKSGPANVVGQFAKGATRGIQHPFEGVAQLAIRGAGAVGAISDETAATAQERLANFTQGLDDANISGTAGEVGAFVGEALPTMALPLGTAAKGAGLLSKATALRAATLAATGAATGAVAGGASRTAEEQDAKALLGGALTLVGVPLVERLVAKVGVPLARKFTDRLATGQGKILFKPDGTLTPAGIMLRTRLRHASPGIDDELVDLAMQQIKTTNPKRLPADKDVVPEMVSQAEQVPLTQSMKARDAKGIQDLETAATGGAPFDSVLKTQERALDVNKDIDTAIVNNIAGIKGNRATSEEASDRIRAELTKNERAAKAAKNALYEPLNQSKERITKPTALLGVRDAFVDSVGETGYHTLRKVDKQTAAFVDELAALGRKKQVNFGELWSLSKRVNEASRFRESSASLRELKSQLNKFIDNAPAELFESGTRGAFSQLKTANAANREYKRLYSARRGDKFQDVGGKAIERIVETAKNGEATPELVEKAIFGQAKALDGAGAKQAAVTIRRIVQAAPGAQQRIREVTINRLMDQMTDNGVETAINPQKASRVIDDVINKNRSLLEASGLTSAEITRLKANAYLAALKVNKQGARSRGSSATNRGIQGDFKRLIWKAITIGTPVAGAAGEGGGMGAITATAVAAGATTAAAFNTARRAANRTLSTKPLVAPAKLSKGARRIVEGATRASLASLSASSAKDK